jgi:serine/threonine-protein kinase
MGSVWRAEHVELGTPIAVKLIDEAMVSSTEARARFKREAQAAARLRSIHVAHVTDYGVDGDTPYISMELLEGESLGDRLARLGRLEPRQVAVILSQVAKAVQLAHESGIVHRDLKPENIFLVRDGNDEIVKVLDFGVAKTNDLAHSTSDPKTRTGSMLGTPYYMSPEQVSGKNTVDHRADIWALGVIGFEALTGRRPFNAETLGGLAVAICAEPIPVPSEVAPVPSGFDAWFSRTTAREPSQRYSSVREVAFELRRVCGVLDMSGGSLLVAPSMAGDAVESPKGKPESGSEAFHATDSPASVTVGTADIPTRSLWPWVGAAVLLLLATAAVTVALWPITPPPSSRGAAPRTANAAAVLPAPERPKATPSPPMKLVSPTSAGAKPPQAPRREASAPSSPTAQVSPPEAERRAPTTVAASRPSTSPNAATKPTAPKPAPGASPSANLNPPPTEKTRTLEQRLAF